MARSVAVPRFVRLANVLTTTLLRVGLKLVGPGDCALYLLTVRGRKSGQPRTTPIAVVEQAGQRYLITPYGVVDWARNLRAAGTASLLRGRRVEEVQAVELPPTAAATVLQRFVATGKPIGRFFAIAADASAAAFEQLALTHPVFILHTAVAPVANAADDGDITG